MDAQAINQQANDTALGIFAVIFVLFAIIVFSSVIAVGIKQRALKCPKCSNWRGNKSAIQTVKSGEKTTTKPMTVCAKCGHEF